MCAEKQTAVGRVQKGSTVVAPPLLQFHLSLVYLSHTLNGEFQTPEVVLTAHHPKQCGTLLSHPAQDCLYAAFLAVCAVCPESFSDSMSQQEEHQGVTVLVTRALLENTPAQMKTVP